MAQRRRTRRTDPDVVSLIERLALEGWTATQTLRQLEGSDEYADRAPSLRTVQDIARRVTPQSPGEQWTFATSDPDDAGTVLAALAAAIGRTGGRVNRISLDEAAMIARIARARPTIPPVTAWECARLYLARKRSGHSTDGLDAFLAFEPWRDGGELYAATFAQGYLHPLTPVRLAGYHQKPITAGTPPSEPMWIEEGEQL